MDKTLHKVLLEELKNASTTLQKYEEKVFVHTGEPPQFVLERIAYWSNVCDKLRTQLFDASFDAE